MAATMKEAIVGIGPTVRIVDSPIPTPGPDQVLTKVVVSGSNPKDWKLPNFMKTEINQGDDIAGIVHAVGENVTEFKPGDRIAAFHEMRTAGGSYAEYAVSWQHTTFHIPQKTSFEEAATLPLAAMTAAIGLYLRLGLPNPWTPAESPIPLVVYGGATAVGSFALQFAAHSNIHPLIVVAGRGIDHVEKLIDPSKGDVIIDYRKGNEVVVQGLQDALKKAGVSELHHALDAVSEHGSTGNIAKVLAPTAKLTRVLPVREDEGVPSTVTTTLTSVGSVHGGGWDKATGALADKDKEFGYVYFRLIARGLQQGWFHGHPTAVVPGGLYGVQKALQDLKDGKASAVKYVFVIADTEGVEKEKL